MATDRQLLEQVRDTLIGIEAKLLKANAYDSLSNEVDEIKDVIKEWKKWSSSIESRVMTIEKQTRMLFAIADEVRTDIDKIRSSARTATEEWHKYREMRECIATIDEAIVKYNRR